MVETQHPKKSQVGTYNQLAMTSVLGWNSSDSTTLHDFLQKLFTVSITLGLAVRLAVTFTGIF